jgi:RHS repeat-associated protein
LTTLVELNGATYTYAYDNANRRTSVTLPTSTGITVNYGYDNAGHTTSIKAVKGGSTTLLSLTYSYTKSSLKTGATYSDNTSLTYNFTYSYDVLNRLTGVTGSGNTSSSYIYDGAGNRTSATSNGVTTTYNYNAADELTSSLTNGTTTTYAYDGNGNQISGASRAFTINDKNQITSVTKGGTNNSYTYSGLDQTDRVQVNGATAIYSALGLSVDGAGSASPTYYTRTNAGELVSERTSSGTYYYLTDDLGSVIKVVDSNGTVKNSYYYDAFGNSLTKSETVSNPWQYAGGYLDATTGLYKFGTRYYDPQTGRWTQKDPIGGSVGKIGSGNPYVYADNEPNMQVDPSGKGDPFDCFIAWLTAIGAVVALVIAVVIAFVSLPVSGPIVLGLAPIEWGLIGAGFGYILLEASAWQQFYHGACE